MLCQLLPMFVHCQFLSDRPLVQMSLVADVGSLWFLEPLAAGAMPLVADVRSFSFLERQASCAMSLVANVS